MEESKWVCERCGKEYDLENYQSALSLEAVNLDNIKGLRLRILNSLEDTKGMLRILNRL